MASQGTHPQNINDFDCDGSLNTTSDSLNDTFINVHFQQHEYGHDGGQNVQSDATFNIDPDNHFHASISTDTKYYTIQYNTTSFISNIEHNYTTTAIFYPILGWLERGWTEE